jgi:hypothetical protein
MFNNNQDLSLEGKSSIASLEEEKRRIRESLGIKDETSGSATSNLNEAGPQANIEDEDLHIMPVKFLPHKSTRTMGASTKIVLIFLLLVIFLGGLLGGAWWWLNKQKVEPNNNSNAVANVNASVANNENNNINNNANNNANTDLNNNSNNNGNLNVNNENINSNEAPPPPPPLLDADADGLTQVEEVVFSTNSNKDDTDRDGYKDGQEVRNLYDPLTPGGLLINSGLVLKYEDSLSGYSVFRPKSWVVQPLAENNSVVFLPDDETGDAITIRLITNGEKLTLDQIFTKLSELLGQRNNYQNFTLGSQPALRSLDGRQVIALQGDYIYFLNYELGSSQQINFMGIFEMMLNSFSFVKTPVING